MNLKPEFFLGANSETGFVSYFKELQEQESSMQLFILKGGPGSGKSTLIKRVLKYAEEKGHTLEVIPCASDPHSLDAFIDYTAGFSMMDGTAPHTEDPSLPGARHHILNLGDLWDTRKLSEKADTIENLSKQVSDCHSGAGAYIKSAAALLKENGRYAKSHILMKKALSVSEDITRQLKGGKQGKTSKRLLSAVSVGEIKVLKSALSCFADKVYVLCDQFGAAADYIMKTVYFSAKLKGENQIYCPCSISPGKCDHLIFPDSRIAIVTGNDYFDFESKYKEDCFYSPFPLEEDMLRLKDEAARLLSLAASLVKKAKDIHDDLEDCYKEAMNFGKTNGLFEGIISEFYS